MLTNSFWKGYDIQQATAHEFENSSITENGHWSRSPVDARHNENDIRLNKPN